MLLKSDIQILSFPGLLLPESRYSENQGMGKEFLININKFPNLINIILDLYS